MKRDISNLKANILAYQDLLVIKEAEIRTIQGSMSEYGQEGGNNSDDKLRIELENIRELCREKIETIAKLEQALNKSQGPCNRDHDSGDEETNGNCSKEKLRKRVYRKVEHMNEVYEKRVEEVHQRYKDEILQIVDKYEEEIAKMQKQNSWLKNRLKEVKTQIRDEIA